MALLSPLFDRTIAVSDEDALAIVSLLGPVALEDDVDDLRADLADMVSRLPNPTLTSTLLDWWVRVHFGSMSTSNGFAFQLPDLVTGTFREALEQLRDVHAGVPAAEWLLSKRWLDNRVTELQPGASGPLDLDWYGAVKLHDEREFWGELLTLLQQNVEALRGGHPGPPISVNSHDYERVLGRTGIDRNSRRWNEMVRRAEDLLSRLESIRAQAEVVTSARATGEIPNIPSVPEAVCNELGDARAAFLFWVLEPDGEQPDSADVAAGLDPAARELNERERGLLVLRVRNWLETGVKVPSLDASIGQLREAETLMAALRDAGVDADEVELLILDGDFSRAAASAREISAAEEHALRATELRQSLTALQRQFDREDVDSAESLNALASELDALLQRGDFREVQRRLEEARVTLDKAVSARRREQVREAIAELAALGVPRELLFDLEAEASADEHHQRSPSTARLDDIAALVTEHHNRRASELSSLRMTIQTALEDRDSIPQEAALDVRQRLGLVGDVNTTSGLMEAIKTLRDLADELGRRRVRRWKAGDQESELIGHVVAYCKERIDYDEVDVRRFLVALKTKPFVILAGLTGSGKSSIVRLVAESLGANPASGHFRRVAVRPDWIDQSETLGYINPVGNRFEPGWLADVIRSCQRQPERLFFVLLDEMNLAPVEQYLAELLSAMEEARAGFGDVVIPLYTRGAAPVNADEWPSELTYPANLFVVGTVNVDETTRPLSDRVIDRANVLQPTLAWSRRHHDGARAAERQPWLVEYSAWTSLVESRPSDAHHDMLVEIGEALHGVGIGFGLRAHIELERFLTNAEGVLDDATALDLGVVQRVVPKIRGFKRELAPALEQIRVVLAKQDCTRSTQILDRWLDSAVPDDSFLDGTAPHLESATR